MATAITSTDFKLLGQSNTTRKLSSKELAPDFTVKDVYGKSFSLSDFQRSKILLSFYRNVGCPVCNFRFHELQKNVDYLKANNIILVSIYESTEANLKEYLTEEVYSTMIPDPSQKLYQLYKVDRSVGKIMAGMFHGALSKMSKGEKLFKNKIKQDGNTDRIGADFFIDERGRIIISHYHKYLGDDLSIEAIKQSEGMVQ